MKWINQFTQSPDGLLHAVLAALPALEAEALSWQRVDIVMASATPGANNAIQGFKRWLAQQKSCPDLRFTPLPNSTVAPTGLVTAGTGGLYGATVTGRLYAAYIKKTVTPGSALPSYLTLITRHRWLSGLAAAIKLVIPLGAVSSGNPGTLFEGVYINPNGLPLTAGLRFALTTAAGGIVISAAADGGDGFCLTTP
jgi:hypothetical protein